MQVTLEDAYDLIQDDVIDIYHTWGEFERLFGNPAAARLLNDTVAAFSSRIHRIMLREMILSIARLIVDPPNSGGYENLSLAHLIDLVSDQSLKQDLEQRLAEIRTYSAFVAPIRNKVLAHTDLFTKTTLESQPLPDFRRKDISKVLQDIEIIMHKIESYLGYLNTGYMASMNTVYGAQALLAYLTKAKTELDRERIEG